jgi:ABC-type uncharacterized transport system permease subunit
VRVLANKLVSPGALGALVGIGLVWAVVSEFFWRYSIRRYTSASS